MRAVCGLAPAAEPFVGRKAFEPGELPLADGRPVLVVAGIEDVLVDIGSSIAPLFERLTEPCSLVGIEATDHFHFCDRVPLLHQMHENNPRAMATRRTLPYTDTLEEKRIHRIVSGLVAHFFEQSLAGESARPHAFSQQALDALDVAARHLSVEAARALGS